MRYAMPTAFALLPRLNWSPTTRHLDVPPTFPTAMHHTYPAPCDLCRSCMQGSQGHTSLASNKLQDGICLEPSSQSKWHQAHVQIPHWSSSRHDQELDLLGHQQNWMPGFSVTSAGNCSFIEQYDGSNWGWSIENCIGQNPCLYICQIRACDSTYGTCDCIRSFRKF